MSVAILTPNISDLSKATPRLKVAAAAAEVMASIYRANSALTPLQRFGSQSAVDAEKVRRFVQHKAKYQKFQEESQQRRDKVGWLSRTTSEWDVNIADLEESGKAGEVIAAKEEKAKAWEGSKTLLDQAKQVIGRLERWSAFLDLESDDPGW
ncbi:hypothetical protein LTR78_001849 [Recurvomyces mirabilis]|uniref:Uncharacterized protein n=1 Tax=Recurvomyces mirabilis TaxID=574656 RepID=A0AAE0WUP0_9PEZI|nr:hypothetical protein LTR78_001849 [Recurvomyces mirabilis]KAK5156711.1 hypothetical protein LTS14_004923 [Recurvomyces mirabilis]